MSEKRISARRFHEAAGTEDWRVLFWGAQTHYKVDSLRVAAELIVEVAEAATELGHFPDLDIRPEGVTIRTSTSPDGSLGQLDIDLARRITELARRKGLEPDPTRLQVVGIAVAQDKDMDVRPFWAAALGYQNLGDEDAVDPNRRNPHLWFHEIAPAKPGRGRVHIDVSVPADQAVARVEAAVAAGGRIVDDSHAPEWWTLASPDNHGIDIAAWPDSEDYQNLG